MLKVMFTIDCAVCSEQFETAAVCSDPAAFVWQSFAWDLTGYVASSRWEFAEATRRFRCDSSMQEAEALPEQPALATNIRQVGGYNMRKQIKEICR